MTSADAQRLRIANGPVWTAESEHGVVVGFLAAEAFDRDLHIWEVAVRQDYQKRGIGYLLMRAAEAYARERRFESITLTTFRDLEWNELFYARLGYATLRDVGVDRRLSAVLAREVEKGLPGVRRCAMRRAV